ncbi:MAG: 6-bladed beta-propeller [Gemmatimonadetes bacterium]|nr:6-bladed beta-propeller [Gemmatimonadota bacterium]
MRSPLILLLVALLLAGCADRAADPRTTAATPVVVTGTGDTIPMRETLRVGVLDGDPNYQFDRVLWLLARRDGGVLVYDMASNTQGKLIRQYDAQGRFVRVIGGRGEGPGEYDDFPQGTLLADGSLLIVSQGQQRIMRFDSAGKFTGSWPGPTAIVDVAPATDSGWYVASVSAHYPQEEKPRAITYFRYDRLGQLVDTIPAPAAYRDGPFAGAFGPTAMIIVLPDGRFVSSRTDSIAFQMDGPTGSASYARPSDRARYNEEEKQAIVAQFAALNRMSGMKPQPMQLPDLKQAFSYMVSDPDGRILFLRRTAGIRIADTTNLRPEESRWRGMLEIDVFDSSATYRGRLVTPRDVVNRLYAFGKGHLWLMHEGESGEQYLVRWEPAREVW